MEFSTKLHTIKSGWSIVYFEGLQVIISLKIDFILANSADPNENSNAASCSLLSGSSLFAKVPVKGFPVYKGLTISLTFMMQIVCFVNC